MIFDLTDEDRAKLEAIRAARGHRSQAETLRALIRENTADGFVTLGPVTESTVRVKGVRELPPPLPPDAPRVIKGVREPAPGVEVPVLKRPTFNPQPKKR